MAKKQELHPETPILEFQETRFNGFIEQHCKEKSSTIQEGSTYNVEGIDEITEGLSSHIALVTEDLKATVNELSEEDRARIDVTKYFKNNLLVSSHQYLTNNGVEEREISLMLALLESTIQIIAITINVRNEYLSELLNDISLHLLRKWVQIV